MKPVKNFLFAVLLVSLMAVTTPAGEQDTAGITCTPTATTTCPSQVDDDKYYKEETESTITLDTTDYFLYEAWSALLSVY